MTQPPISTLDSEAIGTLNSQFQDYLNSSPAALNGMHFEPPAPDDFIDNMFSYQHNPAPVFMGPEFKSRLTVAATKIPHLVLRLLKHNIKQDLQQVSQYYRILPQSLVRSMDRNIDDQLLCRADLIGAKDYISVLELNIGSNLGGWETRFYHQKYQKVAAFRDFYQQHQAQLSYRDTLHGLIANMIRAVENLPSHNGQTLSIAFFFEGGPMPPVVEQYWQSILQSIAQMCGTQCHFQFVYNLHLLRLNNGRLMSNNQIVDCFLMLSYDVTKPLQLPMPLLEAFYAGNLILPENPISMLVGDKRNLTLLRQNKDCGLFNEQEKQWIESFIPWSCNSKTDNIEYQEASWSIAQLMGEFKEQLVVKAGKGFQGSDVFLGNQTDAKQWAALIGQCQQNPDFVIQQYHKPGVILGVKGHQIIPYNSVWGSFSFAGQYWGSCIRAVEVDSDSGIINSARGAQVMMVYEHQ